MTLAPEAPATVVDPPEVTAVAGMLRQLWPAMTELMAQRHARTFVRINERHYGPASPAGVARAIAAQPVDKPDAVPDDFCVELPYGDLFLRKWTPEMDRRPRNQTPRWEDPQWQEQERQGKPLGSAKHGECTVCIKNRHLRPAVYRLSNAHDTYSRSSLCAPCGRKQMGGPVIVPRFNSPEEAQAWLDANGD